MAKSQMKGMKIKAKTESKIGESQASDMSWGQATILFGEKKRTFIEPNFDPKVLKPYGTGDVEETGFEKPELTFGVDLSGNLSGFSEKGKQKTLTATTKNETPATSMFWFVDGAQVASFSEKKKGITQSQFIFPAELYESGKEHLIEVVAVNSQGERASSQTKIKVIERLNGKPAPSLPEVFSEQDEEQLPKEENAKSTCKQVETIYVQVYNYQLQKFVIEEIPYNDLPGIIEDGTSGKMAVGFYRSTDTISLALEKKGGIEKRPFIVSAVGIRFLYETEHENAENPGKTIWCKPATWISLPGNSVVQNMEKISQNPQTNTSLETWKEEIESENYSSVCGFYEIDEIGIVHAGTISEGGKSEAGFCPIGKDKELELKSKANQAEIRSWSEPSETIFVTGSTISTSYRIKDIEGISDISFPCEASRTDLKDWLASKTSLVTGNGQKEMAASFEIEDEGKAEEYDWMQINLRYTNGGGKVVTKKGTKIVVGSSKPSLALELQTIEEKMYADVPIKMKIKSRADIYSQEEENKRNPEVVWIIAKDKVSGKAFFESRPNEFKTEDLFLIPAGFYKPGQTATVRAVVKTSNGKQAEEELEITFEQETKIPEEQRMKPEVEVEEKETVAACTTSPVQVKGKAKAPGGIGKIELWDDEEGILLKDYVSESGKETEREFDFHVDAGTYRFENEGSITPVQSEDLVVRLSWSAGASNASEDLDLYAVIYDQKTDAYVGAAHWGFPFVLDSKNEVRMTRGTQEIVGSSDYEEYRIKGMKGKKIVFSVHNDNGYVIQPGSEPPMISVTNKYGKTLYRQKIEPASTIFDAENQNATDASLEKMTGVMQLEFVDSFGEYVCQPVTGDAFKTRRTVVRGEEKIVMPTPEKQLIKETMPIRLKRSSKPLSVVVTDKKGVSLPAKAVTEINYKVCVDPVADQQGEETERGTLTLSVSEAKENSKIDLNVRFLPGTDLANGKILFRLPAGFEVSSSDVFVMKSGGSISATSQIGIGRIVYGGTACLFESLSMNESAGDYLEIRLNGQQVPQSGNYTFVGQSQKNETSEMSSKIYAENSKTFRSLKSDGALQYSVKPLVTMETECKSLKVNRPGESYSFPSNTFRIKGEVNDVTGEGIDSVLFSLPMAQGDPFRSIERRLESKSFRKISGTKKLTTFAFDVLVNPAIDFYGIDFDHLPCTFTVQVEATTTSGKKGKSVPQSVQVTLNAKDGESNVACPAIGAEEQPYLYAVESKGEMDLKINCFFGNMPAEAKTYRLVYSEKLKENQYWREREAEVGLRTMPAEGEKSITILHTAYSGNEKVHLKADTEYRFTMRLYSESGSELENSPMTCNVKTSKRLVSMVKGTGTDYPEGVKPIAEKNSDGDVVIRFRVRKGTRNLESLYLERRLKMHRVDPLTMKKIKSWSFRELSKMGYVNTTDQGEMTDVTIVLDGDNEMFFSNNPYLYVVDYFNMTGSYGIDSAGAVIEHRIES